MPMTPRRHPPRGFAPSEYAARLDRAQQAMDDSRLAALLLMTEPEVRYFSGFLTPLWQSPTRPWFLVVPASGKPVAVVPEIGAALMRRTWIDEVRAWPAPRPEDDGVSLLVETLREVGAADGRIGVLTGPETTLRMPLDDFARLRGALPRAHMVDATGLVRDLRMAKSEAEVAKIAYACEVATVAFDAVPRLARTGRPLAQVFRDFQVALLASGADAVPYLAGAAGPGGYDDVISPPDERRLRPGDVVMLDTGAVYDGYFCDVDRNYAVGRTTDPVRRAHDTLHRATEAGLHAARPGVRCSDLYQAMRRVIAAAGYEIDATGRMGHGLGMQLTEWPSVGPNDPTALTPGMVLALEPGLTIAPGRCLVHEEDVLITESGARLLTRRAPPSLPAVG